MSVTKGSVQYLHMQECLVYAAVDVSQLAFEGASMFRYERPLPKSDAFKDEMIAQVKAVMALQ